MVEYLQDEVNVLNHIDLSGMSFSKDALLTLCSSLSLNTTLVGIHLNDNGIQEDRNLLVEVLELFKSKFYDMDEPKLLNADI